MKSKVFAGVFVMMFFSLVGRSQNKKEKILYLQIEFCQNANTPNCYQLDENNNCANGSRKAVYSIELHSDSIISDGFYIEEVVLAKLHEALNFLGIVSDNPQICLLKSEEIEDFSLRYYSYKDAKNNRQRLGMILPR